MRSISIPFRSLYVAAALAACALPARAADPVAVLQQATAAIADVKSVAYDFKYDGHGSLAGHFAGSVRILKGDAPGQGRMWITMEVPAVHGARTDASTMTIDVDGARITHVDEARKLVSRGTMAGSMHLVSYAYYGVLFQFMRPQPFAVEMSDSLIAHLGTEDVNGVPSERVKAANNTFGGADITWSVGLEDRLPHAQSWEVTQAGVTGGFRFETSNMRINTLSADDFGVTIPAGYTAIDEDARNVGVGQPAPDWTLETVGGEKVRLSDLRDEVVVLDFWASWCTPCWQLMPAFNDVAAKFEGRPVRFLGVNAWESPKVNPAAYMKEKSLTYQVLLHGERAASDYKIASLPALFVIDRNGKITYMNNPVMRGPDAVGGELRKAIENALQ